MNVLIADCNFDKTLLGDASYASRTEATKSAAVPTSRNISSRFDRVAYADYILVIPSVDGSRRTYFGRF